MSAEASAEDAAREAIRAARVRLDGKPPKLAIAFVSVSYTDEDAILRVLDEELPGVPVIGGNSGAGIVGPDRISAQGISIVLLAGEGVEIESRSAGLASALLVEAVPVAEAVAQAADSAARRGLTHYTCLVFAPGPSVDGEALVAAVRKGAGARAQLAGGLTGDFPSLSRAKVFADGELRSDRIVITGIFTRWPIGIAARHGWKAVGPERVVTRADGSYLVELDNRSAIDVWLEDARGADGAPPTDRGALAPYLANHFALGMTDGRHARDAGEAREIVSRAPVSVRADGAVQLSASIADGTRVRVMHGSREDLLRAATEAAEAAVAGAGARIAGALVLSCAGRLIALGEAFPEEPERIRRFIAAPIGGACVFGEIARNARDADAFFNTTAVVVAFGA